jgi:hypothetical protein
MYVISVPISVPVSKKKRFYLNLNQYRNAHHFTLSKAKTNYHDIVEPLLKHLPIFDRVRLVYTLYTGTEQLCDTSNICSIVDKFFSDVLVACEKIVDDNRKIVISAEYRWGNVDKHNPRVEVTIVPVDISAGEPATQFNNKESNMQITINQAEIEEAIRERIHAQITIKDGMRIDIDLKATRGDEGYTAVIDIVPETSERRESSSDQQQQVESEVKPTPAKATTAAKPVKKAGTGSLFSGGGAKAASKAVETPAEPEVQVEAEAPAEVEEQPIIAEADAEVAADPIPDTAVESETVAEAAQEPSQEATARPSLFAGLSKPSNP